MMRSIALLSSVAVAMASGSVAPNAQQLWYPDFASDYESGSCTTTPSPAMLAFARGAVSPDASDLAQQDREGCCDTWFPDQEKCGCLGGCPDDNTDAAASPTADSTAAPEPVVEKHRLWYPKFDVSYEEGLCVRPGVNADEVPPNYYTEESLFLHETMDACCERWFDRQESKKCLAAMDMLTATDVRPTNSTIVLDAVIEPRDASLQYEASRSALVAEKSR